jgi:hypothetical protein
MKGIKQLRNFYKNLNEPESQQILDRINQEEYKIIQAKKRQKDKSIWFNEIMRKQPIWSVPVGPQGPSNQGGQVGNDQDEQDLRKEKERQTGETGEP